MATTYHVHTVTQIVTVCEIVIPDAYEGDREARARQLAAGGFGKEVENHPASGEVQNEAGEGWLVENKGPTPPPAPWICLCGTENSTRNARCSSCGIVRPNRTRFK